jgi:hypothetical protein
MSSSPLPPPPLTDARLAGGLLATFLVMTVVASTYAPVTRTFPLIVGVCGSVLSAIEFVRLWRRARAMPQAAGPGQRDRLKVFGWIALAIALTVVCGLVAGGALFVAAFLRVRGRESWAFASAGASSVIVVLYVVLERVLELPLYDGVIW